MDDPPRIPPTPRYFNDDELELIRSRSESELQLQRSKSESETHQDNDPLHKTKVTITTKKPNAIPQHQVIYPLPRIPSYSRNIPSSGSMGSDTGTQASESGYSSAQTQKTGSASKSQKKTNTMTKPPKAITRKMLQTENAGVTIAIACLIKEGVDYYNDGNYANAMKSFKSVLKSQIIRRSQGNDPLVAKMLANIGSIYLRQHRYDHAIESLEKAVRMMKRSTIKYEAKNGGQQLVPTSAPLAWVLNNLGTAKFLKGDHKASLECYWEAINDAKKQEGEPITREMANSFFNVGRIGILQKDYLMALGSLKKSLQLETQLYGEKSIQSIDTLNMIGFVHYSTGSFDQAISIFTDALSIVTTNFGSVDEKVAVSLINVGMVLEKEGDLVEALRCFSTARTVCEKAGLGEENNTVRTVIRSANEIEQKLRILQKVGVSKATKADRVVEHDRTETSLFRQSFKADISSNSPEHAEQRDEIHSDGKLDMKIYTASLQRNRNDPPSEVQIPPSEQIPKNHDLNLTVRNDGKRVDLKTYAAYKNSLKAERANDDYREDLYWQYDDSSMVEEDREEV